MNTTPQTEKFRNTLDREAATYGVTLTAAALNRLSQYYELLNRWNARAHLVAPSVDFVTCRALDRFEEMLPQLIDWAPVNSTLLLFGGEALETRIERLGAVSSRELLPHSEGRFLFVVKKVRVM